MKYMMFVILEPTPARIGSKPGGADAWVAESGSKRITGDRLRPPGEAKMVSVRDGKTIVTDGPFAESKEAIVGFDILDCDSLEEAIEIASRHPLATTGRFELRGFWPFED
jgi:hypothetical protein